MGMQRCAAEDNLDMVSASVHVLALLGGGECPAAGRHSFLYEGRIPVMGLGAYPPPRFSSVQCCRWRGALGISDVQ